MPPSTMRCCGIRDNQRFEAPLGTMHDLWSATTLPRCWRDHWRPFLASWAGTQEPAQTVPFTFCPPKFVESVAPGLFRDRVVGRERRVSRVLYSAYSFALRVATLEDRLWKL